MKKRNIKLSVIASKTYEKTLDVISKVYKKTIIIAVVVAVLGTCVFIQYKSITFNNRCDDIRKEIKELNNKIKGIKEKEATLETDATTSDGELEELKASLATLDQALIDANTKINSLN